MKYRFVWGILLASACGNVAPDHPDGGGGDDTGNQPQTLTVSVTGNGSVASAPAGIDCGSGCSAQLPAGTIVMLTATAAADSAFVGWSGDCAGAGACSITMNAAKTVTAQFAPHGSKRWVQQIGLTKQDSIEKVATDADGHLIAAGTVQDDIGLYLFVKKLAKEDGHELWKQQIAFSGFVDALAVDGAGEVYIAARLTGFGGQPVVTIGTTSVVGDFGDIVVVRFSAANGTVVWVRKWGGDGQDEPNALAVSGGVLYVAGDTDSGTATYDTQTTTNTNGKSAFLVRANTSNGAAIQAKLLPSNMSVFGIAVNDTHVAVVGDNLSALSLDACSIPASANSADAVILDFLTATLACQWSKHFGDSATDNTATTKAVAAYPGGGWAIVGDFRGSILLAPSGTSLTSRGDFDVFAGRFTADGTHVWSFRYGNTGFDLGESVAVTPEGNVVLAGTFDASITFGSINVAGVNNAFVTRMTAGDTPVHEWAVSLGGDDSDIGQSVALGPDGTVYVLGQFNGMTTVAGTSMTSQGEDAWIASLVR
jgi:hypothetical protein